MITITDVRCADCGGEVTLFAVPDKVWKGLGLSDEWVCETCVARRVNPNIGVEELSAEIYKQRRRFNLKNRNRYCGAMMPYTAVVHANPGEGVPSKMTLAQFRGEASLHEVHAEGVECR